MPKIDPALALDRAQRRRVGAVDIVRGGAIVLMALDHTRDYTSTLRFAPENLALSSLPMFLTCWVTHFRAPTSLLLAGVGIGLASPRLPQPALRRFLVTRGLWLLVLELLVTPLGWQFGFEPRPAFALVLWVLGWSMILMAPVTGLPRQGVGLAAVMLIAGHNPSDGIRPEALGGLAPLWRLLHVPGFLWPGGLFIGYPLLPWVAVMAFGYSVAPVFAWPPDRRRRVLLQAGLGALALFVVLRALNGYGNPAPWRVQATPGLTLASFLNLLKYPPSLQLLLMTLGGAALALAWGGAGSRLAVARAHHLRPGTVVLLRRPYLVAHAVAVPLAVVQSGEWRRIEVITHPERIPDWFGVPLPGVYVAWLLVVALLCMPCRLMDRMKSTRLEWWWRYL